MKTFGLHFVGSPVILASVALVFTLAPHFAYAQTGGGMNNGGGDNGGQGGGGGQTGGGGGATGADGALGFDAGVTLERTERATRDPGAFVGAQAPTTGDFGAVNQQQGLGGGGFGLGQLGQSFNFFNQLNRANQLNQQSQQNQLRIPLRLGFDKPQTPATNPRVAQQVGSTLSVRFANISRFAQPIHVSMQEGTAVLTGSVADEDTRRLAARLAMLEPGVLEVQNDLVVSPPTAPEVLPRP